MELLPSTALSYHKYEKMWRSFWRDVSHGDSSRIDGVCCRRHTQKGSKRERNLPEGSEMTLLTALKGPTLELSILNSGSDLDQKSSYLKLDYLKRACTDPDPAIQVLLLSGDT